MARIVCQVLAESQRVAFLWSQGEASFEPYRLSETETERFYQVARRARDLLAEGSLPALAGVGQELYRLIFRESIGEPVADRVRQWLSSADASDGLDIVSDVPGQIPWSVVYDLATPTQPDITGFWGVRFPLTVGRRVNPLRLTPYMPDPVVLLVLPADLPKAEQDAWQQESSLRSWTTVDSGETLRRSLAVSCADILYVSGHVVDGKLQLGSERFAPSELRAWIDAGEELRQEPLVVLDVTASAAEWPAFLAEAARLFPGLITWEAPPRDRGQGRALLAELTQSQQPVAHTLQELRRSEENLAVAAFCPPSVRLGGEPGTLAADYPLPATPYRPLAAYERQDRPLFGGRDRDIFRFASLLDEASSHLVLLHGLAGVGKTSFLQAGVLPFLEEDSDGYLALRDRIPEEEEPVASELEHPVVFLRGGSDLVGQFAEILCAFCAQPFVHPLPSGDVREVPLPELLREAIQGPVRTSISIKEGRTLQVPADVGAPPIDINPDNVRAALDADPDLLGTVLERVTRDLPRQLVVVIEEGENLVLSQRDSTPKASKGKPGKISRSIENSADEFDRQTERQTRARTLAMLASAARSAGRCKFVLSLRTEFLGRVVAAFPAAATDWRTFELKDLTREQLVEAVLLPTSTEPVPFTTQAPFEIYKVGYAEGFERQLVARVRSSARAAGLSAAALLQVVCARLMAVARQRREGILGPAHLTAVGNLDTAVSTFIDRELQQRGLKRRDLAAMQRVFETMHLRQPEGTVTRRFVPVEDLVERWPGRDVPELNRCLEAATKAGLLEVATQGQGDGETVTVGPTQDALVRVGLAGEDQRGKRSARSAVIDTLWIMIPLACLAAALTLWATRRYYSARFEEASALMEAEAKSMNATVSRMFIAQYQANVHKAHTAWNAGDLLAMRKALLVHQSPDSSTFDEKEGEPRGFEWFYLWKLANGQRQLLPGHASPVLAAAVSADSKLLATGSHEGRLFVWDLATGNKRATLTGHKHAVQALAFSADGKTLASAGADKGILLWDAQAGDKKHVYLDKPTKTLTGHEGNVNALVFRDGTLISAGDDGTILAWDMDKGTSQHKAKEHSGAVLSLALAAKGKTLASGGADGKVVLWDAAALKKSQTLDAGPGKVSALAFTGDGTTLATGVSQADSFEGGTIRLWDADSGKPRSGAAMSHGGAVFALAFAADGKTLFSAGRDPLIRLWNAEGQPAGVIKGHLGWVRSLALSPEGGTLVSGGQDADVKVWTPQPSTDAQILRPGEGALLAVDLSPDDRIAAAGGKDGNVYLFDVASGKLLETLKENKGTITGLAFSKTAKTARLAVGFHGKDEGQVKVWQLDFEDKKLKAKELFARAGKDAAVESLTISPDGRFVAYGTGNAVAVWQPDKDNKVKLLDGHKKPVRSLSFASNSQFVASASEDGTVRLWDVTSGSQVAPALKAHDGPVLAVYFVPDNQHILSAGVDRRVNIWKVSEDSIGKGVPYRTLSPSGGAISSLAIAPPRTLLIGNVDNAIRSWNFQQENFTLLGHTAAVRALATANDGLTLLSASDDGTLRIWRGAKVTP